jgi:hypothetical protein
MLYVKNKLWILVDNDLRLAILNRHHGIPAAGQPGREKTYELLHRHYYWIGMYEDTRRYVRTALPVLEPKLSAPRTRAAWSNSAYQQEPGRKSLSTLWLNSHDEVQYKNITMVTDRLTKQHHLIPAIVWTRTQRQNCFTATHRDITDSPIPLPRIEAPSLLALYGDASVRG